MASESKSMNMKNGTDLDAQEKKSLGGGFWAFSKKWQKWRQKMNKSKDCKISATLPVEKPISTQYRETQSELALYYGHGRRSCDIDPRFSLDCPRYSLDEPRASFDGYFINRSTFPRMNPIVSVMESDMKIPPINCIDNGEKEGVPGGSMQTRDYYLDSSSSRRRKSLDRSSYTEIDGVNLVSKVLKDLSSNSLRDECLEDIELNHVTGDSERKGSKKGRRWSWRLWGFSHRSSGGNRDEDGDKNGSNGPERSLSESWQDGDVRGGFSRRMLRSNSSVSWRNGSHIEGSFGSVRKSNVEMSKKMRDEFVLERSRSARHCPSHYDNGPLRFYSTPLGGCSQRRGLGQAKIKSDSLRSIRSVLRF